jgi:hypothetical protein
MATKYLREITCENTGQIAVPRPGTGHTARDPLAWTNHTAQTYA